MAIYCHGCQSLYDENETLKTENAALRAALAPFVTFIEAFDAKPINMLADEFYAIHTGTEWEASLKRSDFRAAREAVKKMEGK